MFDRLTVFFLVNQTSFFPLFLFIWVALKFRLPIIISTISFITIILVMTIVIV